MNGTAQEVGPASSVFEGTNSITSLTGPWNYIHLQQTHSMAWRILYCWTYTETLRAQSQREVLPNSEGDAGMD